MLAVRLIPVVVFAAASLLALKVMGVLANGGYSLKAVHDAQAQPVSSPIIDKDAGGSGQGRARADQRPSWAHEMLGYPEVTGSVSGAKPAPSNGAQPQAASPAPAAGKPASGKRPDGTLVTLDEHGESAGERAVLERLQQRRQELETRARELEIREGLLKAAEKRLEARIAELKQMEQQVNERVAKKEETEAARLKSLVTMYENMKAKEAARIFDRLDIRVLLDVVAQINPRRMSDILAQMSPEAAERLTVELAGRASGQARAPAASDLPKIEGRPRN